MEIKVALYARTSTRDQHPENQIRVLRDYADLRKYEIYKEYIDKISGVKESRPQLDLLMQDARTKKFDAVVVWKLDRLGRSLQHLLQIIQEWKNLGVDFICTTQDINTTTPSGKLIFHIFGALAEFEREIITERIKIGVKRKKDELEKKGLKYGRPKGSKDKKPRRKSGYYNRWNK